MLDLNQLRYFVAVAELEHVGRAAESLNMTQSPLSRQIQDLEDRLQLQLFERVKKRLRLTAEGRLLLKEAKELLDHARRVESKANAWAEGRKDVLEVGYVEGALNCGVLPGLLREFRKQEPDVEMHFHCLRSIEQFQALEDGKLDIAFTYTPPWPSETLVSKKIHGEGFVLASPEGWPSLKELYGKKVELIALSADVSWYARAELVAALESIGIVPDIRHEATKPTTIMRLVSAGMGYAVLQESIMQLGFEHVCYEKMPDDFPYKMDIHMVLRKVHPAVVDLFQKLTQ